MIKISHEVPLCLLKDSIKFNDYQYCLPHLLDSEPEYAKHFYECKEKGIYIIMDNSLHELGKAYDETRLLYWINELKPNEFVVPDVWEDKNASTVNARKWYQISLPEGVEKVVVAQGKSYEDIASITQTYKDLGYKKIAYSYGLSLYNKLFPHPNPYLGKALGRLYVISSLYDGNLLTENDRIHLLGTAIPQEFGWYSDIKCLESIDTSNPIMATLDKVKYLPNGLYFKPKANMNDNFYVNINNIDLNLLKNNINAFKTINNL